MSGQSAWVFAGGWWREWAVRSLAVREGLLLLDRCICFGLVNKTRLNRVKVHKHICVALHCFYPTTYIYILLYSTIYVHTKKFVQYVPIVPDLAFIGGEVTIIYQRPVSIC